MAETAQVFQPTSDLNISKFNFPIRKSRFVIRFMAGLKGFHHA
jgi:hypothetical protein